MSRTCVVDMLGEDIPKVLCKAVGKQPVEEVDDRLLAEEGMKSKETVLDKDVLSTEMVLDKVKALDRRPYVAVGQNGEMLVVPVLEYRAEQMGRSLLLASEINSRGAQKHAESLFRTTGTMNGVPTSTGTRPELGASIFKADIGILPGDPFCVLQLMTRNDCNSPNTQIQKSKSDEDNERNQRAEISVGLSRLVPLLSWPCFLRRIAAASSFPSASSPIITSFTAISMFSRFNRRTAVCSTCPCLNTNRNFRFQNLCGHLFVKELLGGERPPGHHWHSGCLLPRGHRIPSAGVRKVRDDEFFRVGFNLLVRSVRKVRDDEFFRVGFLYRSREVYWRRRLVNATTVEKPCPSVTQRLGNPKIWLRKIIAANVYIGPAMKTGQGGLRARASLDWALEMVEGR
nr:hypothetical protein Iba_chr06dCG1470 [Ipomoea batatas]